MQRYSTRAAVLLSATLTSTGCAPVYNYLDRSGPRYASGSGARYLAGSAQPVAAAATGLKVVSFNIKYAQQVGRAIDLLRSDSPLRGADVIALQEMDGPGVERIAEALGLDYVYYPAAVHRQGRKDFGNAVLVRGVIEEDHKLVLPHPGRFGGMRRIAVAVTAEILGQRMRIYSTHLGTPQDLSTSGRRDQVAAILDDARTAGVPVLVAGDFNNRSVVAAAFQQAGFTWATRGVGRTISLFSWDHVFMRGFPNGVDVRSGVADHNGASDHRPVWVDVPLEPRTRALPAAPTIIESRIPAPAVAAQVAAAP